MASMEARVVGGLSTQLLLKKLQPKLKDVTAVIYNEVAKYADPLTPMAEGDLIDSLRPIIKNGFYVGWEYLVNYAKRLYFGENYNFTKDKHPQARAYWIREAYKLFKKNIMKKAQAVLNG